MEDPTLKGRNQRKVLTLSPTLFSDDVPWAKGATIFFLSFNRSDQDKWVGSFRPPIYAILCLRSWSCWAKGSCRGAAVKRRFPPFHWSREGLLPHHSGLLLIGIWPMLKVACLPSHPLEKLVSPERSDEEAKLSTKLCFSSCSRNTWLVATLIQKVTDGSRLSPLSATVTICHSDYFIHKPFFFNSGTL